MIWNKMWFPYKVFTFYLSDNELRVSEDIDIMDIHFRCEFETKN